MPPSNSTLDKAANEPPGKSHVVWETFPTGRKRVRIRVAPDNTDKFVYKKREAKQPVVDDDDDYDYEKQVEDRNAGISKVHWRRPQSKRIER